MNIRLNNSVARIIGNAFEVNRRARGDKAYKVTADDGYHPMNFIVHAQNASQAYQKAQLAITSENGIRFSVVISEFEVGRPSDITPSQYIKPSDFGVAL